MLTWLVDTVADQRSQHNSKDRSPGMASRAFACEANKQRPLMPPDQSIHPAAMTSSDAHYSNSNSFSPTRESSSASMPNYIDTSTDSYDDSSNSHDDGDCECMETALHIIEQIVGSPAASSPGADWAFAESRIILVKTSISRCIVLEQCRGCRQESGTCMLTLVVYEKLTAVFEEVASWWCHQGRGNNRHQHVMSRNPQRQTSFAMGQYRVDTDEEHRAIFATIITLHLQRLSGLSVSMLENSRKEKWRTHLEYGKVLCRRIKSLEEIWRGRAQIQL